MDGDGKPEIISSNLNLNTISVIKNKIGAAVMCPGGSTTLASSITSGASFQWQVNTGNGFINISNNTNYGGTNTANLQLSSIPASWTGFQFRCVVDGTNSEPYALQFVNQWTGASGTAWENPANWSCGNVPGAGTDVVIVSGTVIISSNVTIHSLSVNPSVNLTVTTGNILTITN
jgi:hypothetical protein